MYVLITLSLIEQSTLRMFALRKFVFIFKLLASYRTRLTTPSRLRTLVVVVVPFYPQYINLLKHTELIFTYSDTRMNSCAAYLVASQCGGLELQSIAGTHINT